MKKSDAPMHLKAGARRMWEKLRADYCIDDAAGMALLQAACEAYQRAQEARELIDKDGAVQPDRFGQLKAHPACAIERDGRGQMISALRALRLAPGDDQ
ncbi:MAG: P27 family phage terminase small subunit [Pseudomonadota bacterium]